MKHIALSAALLLSSAAFAAGNNARDCQNGKPYPRIENYYNNGKLAGYDVFKSENYVEATVSNLKDAHTILTRLCVESAAQE